MRPGTWENNQSMTSVSTGVWLLYNLCIFRSNIFDEKRQKTGFFQSCNRKLASVFGRSTSEIVIRNSDSKQWIEKHTFLVTGTSESVNQEKKFLYLWFETMNQETIFLIPWFETVNRETFFWITDSSQRIKKQYFWFTDSNQWIKKLCGQPSFDL